MEKKEGFSEKILDVHNRLKELNFSQLIHYDVNNTQDYDYSLYKMNAFNHPKALGYCVSCEEKGISICEDSRYRLCNISHGSHAIDFLSSSSIEYDTRDWNEAGVMFIMESPSKDYGIYKKAEFEKNGVVFEKHPSNQWYWIHGDQQIKGYPNNFKGGTYGTLVASAIVTFKLANAYMTNLIKCGLNNPEDDSYKGIDGYNTKCVNNCMELYLKKEIEILQPKVIFTFGSKVYGWVNWYTGNSIKVVGLPHPAGRQRGFKNEYYNVLYFCMIAKWLVKTEVITWPFYYNCMKLFATF